MKKLMILIVGLIIQLPAEAQSRLLDRAGKVKFYSEAPLENIEAITNQALGVLDISNSKIAAYILMKGLHFEKALMEEHFNENYVESDKYPKATFSGIIASPLDFNLNGRFDSVIEGDLTIHGVTKSLTANAVFTFKEDNIELQTTFIVKVADYGIKIPKVVFNNISEEVEVTANFRFQKPEKP